MEGQNARESDAPRAASRRNVCVLGCGVIPDVQMRHGYRGPEFGLAEPITSDVIVGMWEAIVNGRARSLTKELESNEVRGVAGGVATEGNQ